jgi:hypothetical protein
MQNDERGESAGSISLDLTADTARVVRLHLEEGRLRLTIEAELSALDLERAEDFAGFADAGRPSAPPSAAGMDTDETVPEELSGGGEDAALDAELGEELELTDEAGAGRFPSFGEGEAGEDAEEPSAGEELFPAAGTAGLTEAAFDAADLHPHPGEPVGEEPVGEELRGEEPGSAYEPEAASFGPMQSTFAPALEEAPPEAPSDEAAGAAEEEPPPGDLAAEEEPESLFPSLEEEIGETPLWSGGGEAAAESPGEATGDDEEGQTGDEDGLSWLQDVLSAAEDDIESPAGESAGAEEPPASTARHGEPEPEPEWAPAMGGETAFDAPGGEGGERGEVTAEQESAFPDIGMSDDAAEPESIFGSGEADEAAPEAEKPPLFSDLAAPFGDEDEAGAGGDAAGGAEPDEPPQEAERAGPVPTGLFGRTDVPGGEEPPVDLLGETREEAFAGAEGHSPGDVAPETPPEPMPEPSQETTPESPPERGGYQAPSTILDRNPFTRETEVGHSEPEPAPPPFSGFQQETIIQSPRGETPEAETDGPPEEGGAEERPGEESGTGSAIFDSAAFMRKLGVKSGGQEAPPPEEAPEETPEEAGGEAASSGAGAAAAPSPTASDSGAFEDTARILRDALGGEERLHEEPDPGETTPSAGPEPLPRSGVGAFGAGGAAEEPEPPAKPASMVKYVCPRCKTPGMQRGDKVGAVVTCETCGKAMRLTMKKG